MIINLYHHNCAPTLFGQKYFIVAMITVHGTGTAWFVLRDVSLQNYFLTFMYFSDTSEIFAGEDN